jgi:hypothetical protein
MTTTIDTNTQTLINLWAKTLGTPTPSEQQFIIWMESHPSDVVRYGILRAATKNQTMNGGMCQDHKIRFASKVMLTASALRKENAEKHERVRQEFEGQVQR